MDDAIKIRLHISHRLTKKSKQQQINTHFGDSQCRTPVVLENIKADTACGINIRVIDLCSKRDLGRLERIISWKLDGEEEHPSLERAVRWTWPGEYQKDSSKNKMWRSRGSGEGRLEQTKEAGLNKNMRQREQRKKKKKKKKRKMLGKK